ncbi:cobalamin B12-binding domain-containing protein [Bacillus taeanensis]|uniref:cobalamin B12-binding domain-containing protein n=1 Tax=Bacillus taeanensis TaxID=273032 RepID=UPI001FE31752|nr:cobalamin B12-binding domain-containing protein [Bacillus taeanensis]
MLGLKMTALLFEEYGWDTRLLGANLPLEYAKDIAEQWQPDVIGLSVTIPYFTQRLPQYIETLSEMTSTVLVGGRLVSMYDFSAYCNEKTKLATDLCEISNWLNSYKVGVTPSVND